MPRLNPLSSRNQPAHNAPEPVPHPAAAAAPVTALLDMKLGDVLLKGVLKDPADAGRLIALAISDAESSSTARRPRKPSPPNRRRLLRKLSTDDRVGDKPMRIHIRDFRVREGDEVDLKTRSTIADPVYDSKAQYESLLAEHVAKLSALGPVREYLNRMVFLCCAGDSPVT